MVSSVGAIPYSPVTLNPILRMKSPFTHGLTALSLIIASALPCVAADARITLAMLPKAKDNPYFLSCKAGADKAAGELGIEFLFDGPSGSDPVKQNQIVQAWIGRGVNVIAVAAEDKAGISPVLREAQAKGVKVITYDADAMPDARSFFVNQATPQGIGFALADEAARLCEQEGEFAIITASLTAANQREWERNIRMRLVTRYPKMKIVEVRPCDDRRDKAQSEATALLAAHPNLKLLMSISAPGVPGTAEAVKQAGKAGTVKVIGLGLPNENKPYVLEGVTQSVVLWNTNHLGYLTVYAGVALAKGNLKPGAKSIDAGSLGSFEITEDNIFLGKPFIFNKANIEQFDF